MKENSFQVAGEQQDASWWFCLPPEFCTLVPILSSARQKLVLTDGLICYIQIFTLYSFLSQSWIISLLLLLTKSFSLRTFSLKRID